MLQGKPAAAHMNAPVVLGSDMFHSAVRSVTSPATAPEAVMALTAAEPVATAAPVATTTAVRPATPVAATAIVSKTAHEESTSEINEIIVSRDCTQGQKCYNCM